MECMKVVKNQKIHENAGIGHADCQLDPTCLETRFGEKASSTSSLSNSRNGSGAPVTH